MTTFFGKTNNATSAVADVAGINGTSDPVTFNVTTGEGSLFPASNFKITIDNEILLCTSRTGDALTCSRASEGTTIAAHTQNADVEHRITAATLTEYETLSKMQGMEYAADAGSTDAYAVTLAPAPTAYFTGMVVKFKANTLNTGAATLNVNSLGAKDIKKNYNSALETGDIVANQLVSVIYDGTNFQMLSPSAALSTATVTTDMYQNALLNGGFDVWQRATTFTYNDDVFGPDRWNLLTETNGAWTCARDTDVPTGDFKYSAKFTNVTLNNQAALVQILENIDAVKFQGKTVSLSFYAKTSGTEIGALRATVLSWTSTADSVTSDVIGTWASDGTDPTWATNWTSEVAGSNKTLTSSWQRFTIENIAVDTSSITNLAVVIWVDDGTIAANDDFWVTGVKLNVGATATSWMARHYQQELTACRRYCYTITTTATNEIIAIGSNESTTRAHFLIPLSTQLRTLPTLVATAGDWQVTDLTTGVDVTTIQIFSSINSTYAGIVSADVAAGLTAGRGVSLRSDTNAGRILKLEAEL